MSDFHFLRPECIFLILPLAILFFIKQVKPLKAGNWQSVISPKLQKYMLYQQAAGSSSKVIHSALWLAALLAILALAGPSWEKQASAVYRSSQGLVIGLDLSLSMTSQDSAPSRIQRAKYKIIDVLQSQQGKNISLIAYAGDAHVVSPLTQDINTIKSMLPALDPYIMPKQGSNLIHLAKEAVNLFEQGNSSPRTLLLVTDGVESNDIAAVTSILNEANIDLAILAVGTEQGAPMVQPDGRFFKDSQGQVIMPPLEWDNLVDLASSSGSPIQRLTNNDQDINSLLSSFRTGSEFKKDDEENMSFDQWLDSGYWLVIPLLVLCLGAFRKGIVLSLALFILFEPNASYASSLPDILLNGDQQGEKYFSQDPKKAAEKFNDSNWKASSLYKAGDYQGALEIWQNAKDAQGLYNKGNALAQLQKFDEAIAAYNAALKQQPDLEDAIHNKALLEQLKQQQNQSNDNQQGDSQNNQQQQGENKNGEPQQSQQGEQSKSQQDSQSQKSDAQSSESQQAQQDSASQGNQESESGDQTESDNANPLQQAQTETEKQREEEMKALKQQMAQQEDNQQKDENGESASTQTAIKSSQDLEQEQAMQQWIQRIPDDPGGLLRNKFLYQYQQRQGNTEQDGERKPW